MISIIICSRNVQLDQTFYSNLQETIGVANELIIIDNSGNKYSIFEAYNLGIKKSLGDYLCFIHDDIRFHTLGWGKTIESIFQSDATIGLIGVAGTKVKSKIPSAWWDCPEEYRVINIKQHLKSGQIDDWYVGWKNNNIEEVVAIDGVFMVMRKNEQIIFDEALKGFHCYDLYLSLQHLIQNKKVIVTNRIFLEHFSEGCIDKSWLIATSLFHILYKKHLVVFINGRYTAAQLKKMEYRTGTVFIKKLLEEKLYKEAIYWWFEIFKLKPKSKYHYRFWKQIVKQWIN